uniref:Activator of Hsp90 ATPase N-terminal domain-containing protein n=1 Tax=Ditylum brightwellii TaxID=49249 RepID=A0A6V2FQQ8_9STRA|mmetsp:Transcript_10821/g.14513  ORF Transcript_10821/g.14513 Transcript_10821/m.14513 type:complete len:156 (-) Transcript_10821:267-734(-)
MPSPRQSIEHVTDINAPIDFVWKLLIDTDDWEWNKWTRLKADGVSEGIEGKLMASYEGDNRWKTFDFKFAEVNSKSHVLSWSGSVGPSGCLFQGYHTMRLEAIAREGEDITRLFHTEKFGGLLPIFGLGLPYNTLDRNYLLMNESLKNHAESIKE